VGGTHPTIRPEECLDYADMVAIGESEGSLIELTRKMQNKQYYYDVKGMGFNDRGKIIINKLRELPGTAKAEIKHLDQIPFQDYDYKSHFVLNGEDIVKMDTEIFKKYWDRTYMTFPTRGCPFACTYCVNDTFLKMYPHQKPIRKRSVDNIIMELQKIRDQIPPIRYIVFGDDAFFLMSLDEISDFSKKYKEHIRIPLIITGATPSTLTKEKLSLVVDAGLAEVRMGIQTAGTSTKKLYKRPHTNQQVENAVRIIHSHKKVRGKYDIILDSPWDTDEDLIETLMFFSKLPTPFQLTLYSLVFFPGTELYRKAKKEGIIKDDLNDVYRKHYHGCKNTYLNKLFFLLNEYVFIGVGIAPKMMSFLTHKKTRQLHMGKPLFMILKIFYPFFKIKRFLHTKGLRGTLYRLKATQISKIARLFK